MLQRVLCEVFGIFRFLISAIVYDAFAAVLSVSVGWILSVLSAAETAFVVECSAVSRIPALQPAVIAVTATIKMIATSRFK